MKQVFEKLKIESLIENCKLEIENYIIFLS